MKKKIIFIEIFIICFIMLLLTFFVFFINIPAYKYFNSKKESLLLEIKNATEFDVKYQKISPNIIGKINVFEVILYNSDGTRLELGDIEISYSIFSFLRAQDNLLSFIKKVKLKTFNLRLNKENDFQDIKKIIKNIKNKKNKSFNLKNLLIEIPKGKINIIDGNKEYIFLTDNLKIFFNDHIKINALLNIYIKNNEKISFNSKIKTDGLIKNINDIYTTKFEIELQKIVFGTNKLKIQRFLFESKGKDFVLNRLNDSLPVKFILKKEGKKLITDINIDNIYLKKMFILNKKGFQIPDTLTLKSDLNIDLESKEKKGGFTLITHYNKLLFLKNFNIDFKIHINNNILFIDKFSINNISKDNYIKLEGNLPLYPSDFKMALKIKDFLLPSTNINTEIFITKKNNVIDIIGDYFLINGFDIGQLYFNVVNQKKVITIKSLKEFNGYSLAGNILKKEKGFKANLVHTFSNFSISNILKAYNKKIKKDLFLNGSLTNVFSKNKFEIQNSKFSIFNEQREISTFNLLLHNNLFNVYKLKINNQKNPIDIKGWINFNKKPIIGFVNIKSDKFKFDIISNITNETIGIIINRRLHATINFNEKHVYFRAKKFKIPINGNNTEINFSFDLNLNTNSIRENRISINKMNIFKGETGNLTAKMNLKNNILTIKDLKYQDNSNEIIGKLVHEIKLKDKIIINGKGFFTDDAKEESYSLDYEIIDSDINAKLYVTHMDIKKIIKKKIDGFINSRLSIYGPVKNPNYNLELDISRGNFLNNDLNAFFIINKNDKDLNIKKASISIAQNRISLKDSIIHFGEDNLKNIAINGSIHIEGLQKILKTNFLLKGDFNSITDEKSPINIDLELENTTVGYLKALDLTNVEKFLPIKLNIARKNKTMILKNYGDKFIYATKHENDVVIKFYNKDETVFETIIDISDGNLDGKAKFLKFPVNAVQKILVPFVGINEGLIDGEIEIKGKHKHPEFYGKLNLFYGVVSLPDYLQVPVINITGIIIADKDKLLVRNVNAEVKKGLVHGYGEILFNGWKFERYLFHLNSDSIPCLIKQGPIDAKGIGYIEDFIFEGKPKNFNFIADLVIESADINLASLMGVNKKRNLMKFPINVFIKFKSGKKVKVNYPIIKGIVKPGEIFTFKYIGEESRAFLGGNVNLKKGDLYYLDKTFKIEQASFQFFEDEIRINPNVNLKAYNRTKDSKGDAVKIYLTMNNRLIPFETTFSSFPYKTQEEISGLLGLSYAANTQEDKLKNILDEELKDTANIETLVNTTNYLSNSFIFTPIENRIRKVTGLDTFSMNTNFLGNIIKSNTTYYTNSLDLLDDSSITLGKYIFNELYFEFMTSFDKKTDATEQLFLPLPNQNYGLNFELMLQLELQYLLIGYTFLPKDYSDLLNAEHLISLEANFKL